MAVRPLANESPEYVKLRAELNADLAPGQLRGMDLLSPFWNFLDLTPEGRGEFMPKRSY